ncbi:hypothetical protein BJV78DRAFT_1247589 [Lactifluus subvellereus]|nr:hypothetical protein BJV78DRAFT_1247589 [Lactifluus subvellereus]
MGRGAASIVLLEISILGCFRPGTTPDEKVWGINSTNASIFSSFGVPRAVCHILLKTRQPVQYIPAPHDHPYRMTGRASKLIL